MKNRIIRHWCLYYMWLLRYFEKGRLRKGAKDMAERLLIICITIYAAAFIVLPIGIPFSNGSNPFREHRLIFIVLFLLVLIAGISLIGQSKLIKETLKQLTDIEDWYNSPWYRRGKRIVLFHFIFSFLSVPIVIGGMILLSKLLGY
jgi:hypothetical protein